MEGKVTIDLKDFDLLREHSIQLKELRRDLENKIQNAEYEENSEKVTVSITKKTLNLLIRIALENDENHDWIAYDFKDENVMVNIID